MFFLKKLLQFIEEKGFRAGAGADKQWGARAAVPAGGGNESAAKMNRGRVVRREKAGAQVQGGCVRGAASESAARGEFRNADEQYAWYFAVRDWFARTPQESGFRRTIGGGAVRRAAEERGTRGRIAAAELSAPFRRGDSFGRIAACRSAGEATFRAKQAMFGVDDEFFAPLLSLRGLNVAERMRGEK